MKVRSKMLCSLLALYAGLLSQPLAAQTTHYYLALTDQQKQIFWLSANQHSSMLNIHNAKTGELEQTVNLAFTPLQTVMGFTPDGLKIALLEQAGLSIVHQTGKTLRTLAVPNLPNPVINYQPQQAITNASGTAQLFHDTATKQLHIMHTGHQQILASIQLPKSKLLALGLDATINKAAYVTLGGDGQAELHIYDLFKKSLIRSLAIPTPNHAFHQTIIFSPNDQYVALLPWVINLETGEVHKLKDAQAQAAFTLDKKSLLFTGQYGLQRYDLQTKQQKTLNLNLPNDCQQWVASDVNVEQTQFGFAVLCQAHNKPSAIVTLLDAHTGQWQRNLNLNVLSQ